MARAVNPPDGPELSLTPKELASVVTIRSLAFEVVEVGENTVVTVVCVLVDVEFGSMPVTVSMPDHSEMFTLQFAVHGLDKVPVTFFPTPVEFRPNQISELRLTAELTALIQVTPPPTMAVVVAVVGVVFIIKMSVSPTAGAAGNVVFVEVPDPVVLVACCTRVMAASAERPCQNKNDRVTMESVSNSFFMLEADVSPPRDVIFRRSGGCRHRFAYLSCYVSRSRPRTRNIGVPKRVRTGIVLGSGECLIGRSA